MLPASARSVLVDGAAVIWLRTVGSGDQGDQRERRQREDRADIVIDLHDLNWPVMRRLTDQLTDQLATDDGGW